MSICPEKKLWRNLRVYKNAKKYYMDPEELTDAIIQGLKGDKFSPFSETPVYEKEEWEAMMTQRYGDAWEKW